MRGPTITEWKLKGRATNADTTQRLVFDPKFEIAAKHTDGNVDVPRMREGGLDGLFDFILARRPRSSGARPIPQPATQTQVLDDCRAVGHLRTATAIPAASIPAAISQTGP